MTPEFKFKSSPEHVRRLILRGVAGTSTRVAWSGIAKHNVMAELGEDKDELYLRICSNALAGLVSRTHAKRVHIVLDKRSGRRSLRRHFEEHLLDVVGSYHGGYFAPSTSVSHMDSVNSAGVQVADIVAGAVFRSLEHSDNSYLSLITGKHCVRQTAQVRRLRPPGGFLAGSAKRQTIYPPGLTRDKSYSRVRHKGCVWM
jgi:hypothetical protein